MANHVLSMNHTAIGRQSGASLIGVLIGLVVSVIVILGMLMVFRNTIQSVVPSSEAARSDSERITALLGAHMMLHDAGFGIGDGQGMVPGATRDLVVLASATFENGTLGGTADTDAPRVGNAVIWRQRDPFSSCDGDVDLVPEHFEGLLGDGTGALHSLTSAPFCSEPASVPTREWNHADNVWTSTVLVSESRTRGLYDTEESEDPIRVFEIEVLEAPCSPFMVAGLGAGIDDRAQGSISVALRYPVGSSTVSSTTCLENF